MEYMGLNKDNQHVVEYRGRLMLFKQLHVIEFNSDRKRMSIVLEYEGRIILYCKGADNMIIKRLRNPDTAEVSTTNKVLE